MFKIRQYVNHRRCGVCLIKDISCLSGASDGPKYYVLEPQFGEDKGSIVRVPITNELSMRSLFNKKECLDMIEAFKASGAIYIDDVKMRKTTYESLIGSGDIGKLIPLLFGAKRKKEILGKINSIDHQFINKSEPLIYGNLSYGLSIPYEKVEELLKNCLN